MQPKKLFRISLFRLLVLFTLVGIACALIGQQYYRARQQKEAVDLLRTFDLPQAMTTTSRGFFERYATTVIYDFEEQEYNTSPYTFRPAANSVKPGPPAPKPTPHPWSKWLGVDIMHDVVLVKFNREAKAQDIHHLRVLPGLQTVEFDGLENQAAWDALVNCRQTQSMRITDYDSEIGIMPSLENFNRLSKLNLHIDTVTRTSFINISRAKSLESLRLDRVRVAQMDLTRVSAMPSVKNFSAWFADVDDFSFLEKMPNLRTAVLYGSIPVDKNMFESIGQLAELEKLVIRKDGPTFQRFRYFQPLAGFREGNQTDDAVLLKPLAKLQKLKHLELHLHELSDSDMEFVAMLPELEFLSISNSAIGNRGIDWIEQLPKLKTLKLGTTKITRSGLEGFRQKNPGCKIQWE